jgi:hypothetical protein
VRLLLGLPILIELFVIFEYPDLISQKQVRGKCQKFVEICCSIDALGFPLSKITWPTHGKTTSNKCNEIVVCENLDTGFPNFVKLGVNDPCQALSLQ